MANRFNVKWQWLSTRFGCFFFFFWKSMFKNIVVNCHVSVSLRMNTKYYWIWFTALMIDIVIHFFYFSCTIHHLDLSPMKLISANRKWGKWETIKIARRQIRRRNMLIESKTNKKWVNKNQQLTTHECVSLVPTKAINSTDRAGKPHTQNEEIFREMIWNEKFNLFAVNIIISERKNVLKYNTERMTIKWKNYYAWHTLIIGRAFHHIFFFNHCLYLIRWKTSPKKKQEMRVFEIQVGLVLVFNGMQRK